jgi:hypothetical protein
MGVPVGSRFQAAWEGQWLISSVSTPATAKAFAATGSQHSGKVVNR